MRTQGAHAYPLTTGSSHAYIPGCTARTCGVMVGSHLRLLLVTLVLLPVIPGCAGPSGPPVAKLTDVEAEYADSLALTYASAASVPMDVDKAIRQNIDYTLSGQSNSSNMVRALQEANIVLSALARELREPTPYTMDSLVETNESAAAVFEGAYTSCIDLIAKETTSTWGSDALRELLGAADQDRSIAAKARILACVGSEGDKVKTAVSRGVGALRAKEEEIKAGRAQMPEKNPDCFIATAAYGTGSAVEIDELRRFRDEVLLQSEAGRDYVDFYYAASPPVAEYIAEREWLRTLVRELLVDPIVDVVRVARPLWAAR